MTSKTQSSTPPWTTTYHTKYSKTRDTPPSKTFAITFYFKCFLFFCLSLTSWFIVLFLFLPLTNPNKTIPINHHHHHHHQHKQNHPSKNISVYIYKLPPEFNHGLLKNCTHLNIYTNMCPHVANHGLGQPLHPGPVSDTRAEAAAWFATHQFIAEMIFHARMENHPLRTREPTSANLFYVPFFGGLHASSKFREKNLTARDELAVRLVDFLKSQPTWRKNKGRDHFIVLGRTAWDFMRSESGPDFGANSLLNMPLVQCMSVLTVERHPWKTSSNQHGLPYPSYFHPATSAQMLTWQTKMRDCDRPHLFSFIGAPRKGLEKAAIRDELIRQCGESTRCELLQCNNRNNDNKCYKPDEVLKLMSKSEFCLQAPGDSFTRRSTFDAILAGCVPVFFSPHTAYTQYGWFLPDKWEEYSIYIEDESVRAGMVRVEEMLLKIPKERVEKVRKTVIDLIPRLTYKHPNANIASDVDGFDDVVDVALDALARHVGSILGHD